MYKERLEFNNKKTDNPLKQGKNLEASLRKIYRWKKAHENMFNIISNQGKANNIYKVMLLQLIEMDKIKE